MGRYIMKMAFLLLLLHFFIFLSCSTAVEPNKNGVCKSKGGKFPPYVLEGKPPKSANREFKNLNMCKVFLRKTCCSASQMKPVSLALESLATYGEADEKCLELFELLECSVCEPDVGIQSGPLRICASFCDRLFEACSDAHFSILVREKVRTPCGLKDDDIICGKASYLESNGTAFCNAVGFTVQTAFDSIREPCYRIEGSLEELMESVVPSEITLSSLWFQNFLQQFVEMPLIQKISWVLTGVGLGGHYIYRWYRYQEAQAIVQMHAMRLGDYRNRNVNANFNGHA